MNSENFLKVRPQPKTVKEICGLVQETLLSCKCLILLQKYETVADKLTVCESRL
jgi:hypothetical protein